ncbi:MAG: HmuY family protein [Deltaproteobacteria bacterium]|nr:HmuY family protein [Nannocystaceae bacterium]
MRPTTTALLLTLPLSACAEDLGDALGDDDSGGDGEGGSQVENVPEGRVVRTTVDATDAMRWIWFDFQTRAQVDVADPLHSEAWDLGFSRYSIAINGGVSGEGGMEAVVLEDTTLDAVTAVPEGPWITDAADSDDQGDDPDYALAGWYDYDFATHMLSARPTVYVVRSVEGEPYALSVVDYYDEAGSSGWMQLRWKPLAD